MSSVELTGDLERKFDLEISPLCNQQADSVPAIQAGECASARGSQPEADQEIIQTLLCPCRVHLLHRGASI